MKTDQEKIVEMLDHALEQAIVTQFVQLFGVLCVAEDLEQGLVRFERGLQKMLDAGGAVAGVIRSMEG